MTIETCERKPTQIIGLPQSYVDCFDIVADLISEAVG